MAPSALLHHRLANQRLLASAFKNPTEVVAWLGAMQAQEYAMAKWAIALRAPGATAATIEASLDSGAVVRTHVLRPTWHFVAAGDLRWMLKLSAPRVRAQMAYMNRQLELGVRDFSRSKTLFAKVLGGGRHLTRLELQNTLKRARILAEGPRLAHLLMDAELEGLICSGVRRGKTSTYALVDERVPFTPDLTRDAALAELTRRYFTSRGPATFADFAWWSGLTLTDAKAGVSSLGKELLHERVGGRDFVVSPHSTVRTKLSEAHFLLPDYDEYGIAYKERRELFAAELADTPNYWKTDTIAFNRMLVVDGVMVGSWGRTESAKNVTIEAVPFGPLTAKQQRALKTAVARYSAFIGKQAELHVRKV